MSLILNIADNSVVSFHYILKDVDNQELERSAEDTPLVYLHGQKGMLPALEKALEGKSAGEQFTITLQPQDAYGEIIADQHQRVPKKHLAGAKKWKPGMVAMINTDQGERQVTVVKVGHTMATVDSNHPLAGKTLTFEIDIKEVREASEEEIAHRHAHGPGGHQH